MFEEILKKLPQFTESTISGDGLYDVNNKPFDPENKKPTSDGSGMVSVDRDTQNSTSDVAATINPAQLTVNTAIRFRGEWQPETKYKQGDYVYLKDRRPGFFYRCTVGGTSQSKTYGKSDYTEPGWVYDRNIYDDRLVWRAVRLQDIDPEACALSDWTPTTTYHIGNAVRQQNGKPIIFEDGTEVIFQLTDVITKLDWPRLPDERMNDGTCEWETNLSIGYMLPRERLKEATFYEFVQIVDYLILHEQIYFNDYLHKYNDLLKVRTKSLKEIIAETGYNYVADLLNLEDNELITLVKYMNIISDLKGSKSGLEVVFNLLSMRYSMQEWWETTPKGTPHTWDLSIEVEIEKVIGDMIGKLLIFTRNYIYPIIGNFEITYKINMAELAIVMAGFVDIEMRTNAEKAALLASLGGFVDKDWEIGGAEVPVTNYVLIAGYIDILYKLFAQSPKNPLLIRALGTLKKTLTFKFFLGNIDYGDGEAPEDTEEEKQVREELDSLKVKINRFAVTPWVTRSTLELELSDITQTIQRAAVIQSGGSANSNNASRTALRSRSRVSVQSRTIELSDLVPFDTLYKLSRNLHINGLLVIKDDRDNTLIYQKRTRDYAENALVLIYYALLNVEDTVWISYTQYNTLEEWKELTSIIQNGGLVFTDGSMEDVSVLYKLQVLKEKLEKLMSLQWTVRINSNSTNLDVIDGLQDTLQQLHVNGFLVIKDNWNNTVIYQKINEDNDLKLIYDYNQFEQNPTWMTWFKDNTLEEWDDLETILPQGGLVISTIDNRETAIAAKLRSLKLRVEDYSQSCWVLRLNTGNTKINVNNLYQFISKVKDDGFIVAKDDKNNVGIYQKVFDGTRSRLLTIYEYSVEPTGTQWMQFINGSSSQEWEEALAKTPEGGLVLSISSIDEAQAISSLMSLRENPNIIQYSNLYWTINSDKYCLPTEAEIKQVIDAVAVNGLVTVRDCRNDVAIYQKLNNDNLLMRIYLYQEELNDNALVEYIAHNIVDDSTIGSGQSSEEQAIEYLNSIKGNSSPKYFMSFINTDIVRENDVMSTVERVPVDGIILLHDNYANSVLYKKETKTDLIELYKQITTSNSLWISYINNNFGR